MLRAAVLSSAFAAILVGVTAGAAEENRPNDDALAEAAALILDDAVSKDRREELIARHKADAPRLLRQLTEGLPSGTPEELRRIPWIWRVTVAAGKRNDAAELAAVLDASLPEPDGELTEWQAVVIGGGVINGIGLAGAWPSERIAAVLTDRPELRDRWKLALDQAVTMADDEQVIPGTRYDALRMVALRDWSESRPILERYLSHENAELQQGAVSGLSDVRNAEAPRMLLDALGRLTESNRELALDALARDEERRGMLRQAVESGALDAGAVGEERLKKMREKAVR